jgi:hypothetical protein
MQRNKGKAFERKVAILLRQTFPRATVRRASQAERAFNSDVFCTGAGLADTIWWELQDARDPTPLEKLKQAEEDIAGLGGDMASGRIPIVVWHKLRAKIINATMRSSTWLTILGTGTWSAAKTPVTVALDDLLDVLDTLECARREKP